MRGPKSQDVTLQIATVDSAVRFGTEKYVSLKVVTLPADGLAVLFTLKLSTEQWKKAVAATTPSSVDGVLSRAPRPKLGKTGATFASSAGISASGGNTVATGIGSLGGQGSGLGLVSIEQAKKSV
jgi:hypothetical protein